MEDIRLTRAEFHKMRDEGKFPFNQVPILILDNGAVIAQSGAILRYIGTLAGLYPRDNLELSAVIDSLFDQHQDMMMGVNGSRFPDRIGFGCVTADQIPFVRKSLQEEILPQHFQFFENFLAKSTTGWLASTPDPTIADFAFVARLELFNMFEKMDLEHEKELLEEKLRHCKKYKETFSEVDDAYDILK